MRVLAKKILREFWEKHTDLEEQLKTWYSEASKAYWKSPSDKKVIKTEKDYQQAIERLEMIFDAPIDTSEGDEAEILSILIEKYEDEHYPIGAPNPIEAIKFRMEQMNMKNNRFS